MRNALLTSLRALLVFTVLTGVVYPLAVTVVAQAITPNAARGSLIKRDGKMVGSALLAQGFKKPEYFWSRPSASDYGTLPGSATNLGPTSQKLKDRVTATLKDLQVSADSSGKPYDLILVSASGLDPELTPLSAQFQIDRVAAARGIEKAKIVELVQAHIEAPLLGIIGHEHVNVLKLNLALDSLAR